MLVEKLCRIVYGSSATLVVYDPVVDESQEGGVMTKVATLTDEQLRARREQILGKLGLSRDELRNRAMHYALVGDEYDAWEQLESIAFLLGEPNA